MSSVVISGDTSGAITVSAPLVAGTNTLTLQAATATSAVNTLATAVASTSGTSIDFTGLPSWVKRVTVMFAGVSTSGTSFKQMQLGTTGGVVTTGYKSSCSLIYSTNATVVASATTGFLMNSDLAAEELTGQYVFTLLGSNLYVGSTIFQSSTNTRVWQGAGQITLGGTLDRVRITTVNGTDTFDAGTVNLLLEG
jgi:hypothetical protein